MMNNKLNNKQSASLYKQRGVLKLWHVLLLVTIAVSLVVCADQGKLPINQAKSLTQNLTQHLSLPSFIRGSNSSQAGVGGSTQYSNASVNTGNDSTWNTMSYHHQFIEPSSSNTKASAPTTRPSVRPQVVTHPARAYGSYDEQFPLNLSRGFYTIQVFSGYHSKLAYDHSRSLQQAGYNSRVDQEQNSNGVLFKVRVGFYRNRTDAFAVRDQIRRRYPKSRGDSFVILVD